MIKCSLISQKNQKGRLQHSIIPFIKLLFYEILSFVSLNNFCFVCLCMTVGIDNSTTTGNCLSLTINEDGTQLIRSHHCGSVSSNLL